MCLARDSGGRVSSHISYSPHSVYYASVAVTKTQIAVKQGDRSINQHDQGDFVQFFFIKKNSETFNFHIL
jgi:hypothetical protein